MPCARCFGAAHEKRSVKFNMWPVISAWNGQRKSSHPPTIWISWRQEGLPASTESFIPDSASRVRIPPPRSHLTHERRPWNQRGLRTTRGREVRRGDAARRSCFLAALTTSRIARNGCSLLARASGETPRNTPFRPGSVSLKKTTLVRCAMLTYFFRAAGCIRTARSGRSKP